MIDLVPDGSIYLWMYRQGLKGASLNEIEHAVRACGKDIRQKDYENYWNGYLRSDKHKSILEFHRSSKKKPMLDTKLDEYPMLPCAVDPTDKWVPCTEHGKPMIKWSRGCMRKVDAMAMLGCKTLAENMYNQHFIVIDCDGDHDYLDLKTIAFLDRYKDFTHALSKPKSLVEYNEEVPASMYTMNASFHLTFRTDRIIPTMHFPNAHIDIIGNEKNSLRYLKNKVWNGKKPIMLTNEIWNELQGYIRKREGK